METTGIDLLTGVMHSCVTNIRVGSTDTRDCKPQKNVTWSDDIPLSKKSQTSSCVSVRKIVHA